MQNLTKNKSGYPYNLMFFTNYYKDNLEPDFKPKNGCLVDMGRPTKNLSQLFYHDNFWVTIKQAESWQGDICKSNKNWCPGSYSRLLDFFGVSYKYVTREEIINLSEDTWENWLSVNPSPEKTQLYTWDNETHRVIKREMSLLEELELADELHGQDYLVDPRAPLSIQNKIIDALWKKLKSGLEEFGLVEK